MVISNWVYADQLLIRISFQLLYLHADRSVLLDEEPRAIISRALMGSPTLLNIKRAVHLISHGLKSPEDEMCCALILLLTKMMEDASRVFSANDIDALKEQIFAQDGNLKNLHVVRDVADSTREGKLFFAKRLSQALKPDVALKQLVRVSLEPVTERNKTISSDICTYWLNVVRSNSDLRDAEVCRTLPSAKGILSNKILLGSSGRYLD